MSKARINPKIEPVPEALMVQNYLPAEALDTHSRYCSLRLTATPGIAAQPSGTSSRHSTSWLSRSLNRSGGCYCLPKIRSTTQQPRTCSPGWRQ